MGLILNKDDNRCPTVKECNDAFGGGNSGDYSQYIDTVPIGGIFRTSFPIWLYRESDGTFRPHGTYQQYQHNSSYVVGRGAFTYIDDFRAVSITLARDKYTIAAE